MTQKTLIQLTVLLLSFSLVLAACGGGKTNNTPPAENPGANQTPPAEEKKEVSFTIGYASGDPATRTAISNTIKKFMEVNSHIKIKDISETGSASYLDWLKTKDAVGEFPDLVEMRETELFAKSGKIVELPADLVDLFESVPEVGGVKYNAPLFTNGPQGIIYSKKAYADAGVTELPKTYAEFLDIQEKLKASGIAPIVVGGKDVWHMGFWLNKFLIDDLFAKDPDFNSKRTAKQASFTDEGPVKAITKYKELFSKYIDKGWLSTADNQTASILVSGKAAQLFSGTWMFSQIAEADPNFEFGFYIVPDENGDRNVVGLPTPGGWSFSTEAAKDADKVEAMKEFVRFFFAPEQYGPFLQTLNGIPSTKEKVSYEASEQMDEVLALMADPSVNKSLMINQFWGENQIPQQFRNWFYKLMQDLVANNADVTEYMKKADQEYDNEVKANQQ